MQKKGNTYVEKYNTYVEKDINLCRNIYTIMQ